MLEKKTIREVYDWALKLYSLSCDGYIELCDFFEKEKLGNNWNIDEKEIMACCISNIFVSAMRSDKVEDVEEKRKLIQQFYTDNYFNVAQGTRDYMTRYEDKMNRHKEIYKGLIDYIEDTNQKYVYKKNKRM